MQIRPRHAAAALAAAGTLLLAGCASPATAPPPGPPPRTLPHVCVSDGCWVASSAQAEASAWMAAHPAPVRAGWVNAMILPGQFADVGFAGPAGRQACPDMPETDGVPAPSPSPSPAGTAALTAWHEPAMGNLPGCGAWTATALIGTTGQVVKLACGSIPGRVECPFFRLADGYIPGGGDFVRLRAAALTAALAGGWSQVGGFGDLAVIEEFADSALMLLEPDGGSGYATAPAPAGHPQ